MNAEAMKSCGCEFLPALAVPVPIAGKVKMPRTVPAPFTSRVVAGAAVLIPILPVDPLPVCVRIELCTLVAVVKRGRVLTVPPVVVTSDEVAGVTEAVAATAGVPGMATTVALPASRKAEAGKPPRVCASAAFKA